VPPAAPAASPVLERRALLASANLLDTRRSVARRRPSAALDRRREIGEFIRKFCDRRWSRPANSRTSLKDLEV